MGRNSFSKGVIVEYSADDEFYRRLTRQVKNLSGSKNGRLFEWSEWTLAIAFAVILVPMDQMCPGKAEEWVRWKVTGLEGHNPMIAIPANTGQHEEIRKMVRRAMQQSDELVLVFDYVDAKGWGTRRVASPIRFLGRDRFLALCLSREEPRHFAMGRCRNPRLEPAADFLMPVPLVAVS